MVDYFFCLFEKNEKNGQKFISIFTEYLNYNLHQSTEMLKKMRKPKKLKLYSNLFNTLN